jgi:heavy metal translocating P-type ATPase
MGINKTIKRILMHWLIEKLEYLLELGGTRRDIVFLIISGAALLISFFDIGQLPINAAWIAIILCGLPIVLEAFIGLVTEFDIRADVLVSIALIASVAIGEDFAAGEIAFIMQIGALLETLTVAKARAGIERLVHLTPETARLIKEGAESIIPAEAVKVGDVLRVLPGEKIPADGIITSGCTSVNQAVMTGESLPVDKEPGDEVASGTVNQFGAFEMRAAKAGEDSSIQRMIRLVQSADAGKAKIVRLADRWATWIVVIALSTAVLTWLVTGEIIRAVTILVVFCPCALVLATPTAIMAAIGNATKHGFLVREGDALERLSRVKCICFDKTGTLTRGTPEVTAVVSLSELTESALWRLAASAEKLSEHPLARAIVADYMNKFPQPLEEAGRFTVLPGRGVEAEIGKTALLVGNLRLLKEKDIAVPEEAASAAGPYTEQGSTLVYIAADSAVAGFIVLADSVRCESADTITQLKEECLEAALLTGDNEKVAHTVAGVLGITRVHAGCLPEDKLSAIESMQRSGEEVAMIGDGINDAPALKKANVGIAMGGVGSDIAIEAADIVLVKDEIRELPHLAALSKRTMNAIRWNLTFAMGINIAATVLAVFGIMTPVVGALVHNAGSVLVIINSARLLSWRRKEPAEKSAAGNTAEAAQSSFTL